MTHSDKRRVKLTAHAKQRLEERAPHIHKKDYDTFVQGARYKGLNITDSRLDDKIRKYVWSHFSKKVGESLIVYRGYVFVFYGDGHHNRTLKTVVKLPEWVTKEGKLVENICYR